MCHGLRPCRAAGWSSREQGNHGERTRRFSDGNFDCKPGAFGGALAEPVAPRLLEAVGSLLRSCATGFARDVLLDGPAGNRATMAKELDVLQTGILTASWGIRRSTGEASGTCGHWRSRGQRGWLPGISRCAGGRPEVDGLDMPDSGRVQPAAIRLPAKRRLFGKRDPDNAGAGDRGGQVRSAIAIEVAGDELREFGRRNRDRSFFERARRWIESRESAPSGDRARPGRRVRRHRNRPR